MGNGSAAVYNQPLRMAAKPQLGIVVLAAGRGTRMRSERAKVLHAIAGKPFIVSVLETAAVLAPDRLAVVVGHEADEVERVCAAYLARSPIAGTVAYPRQLEQRGTGDAVRAAASEFKGFDGDVLILYGDVPGLSAPTLQALLAQHRDRSATLSLLTTEVAEPTGYGRILRRRRRITPRHRRGKGSRSGRSRRARDQPRDLLRAVARALAGAHALACRQRPG